MDPVSQTQASELLAMKGLSVVGWYHSHPAFDPNPSLRDTDTQAKYQVRDLGDLLRQRFKKHYFIYLWSQMIPVPLVT